MLALESGRLLVGYPWQLLVGFYAQILLCDQQPVELNIKEKNNVTFNCI